MKPRTMYEKIWDAHVIPAAAGPVPLLYIDRHFIHEATSPQAFAGLKAAGRKVRRPDLTFAVMDHSVPTKNRGAAAVAGNRGKLFDALDRNCRETGVRLFDMNSKNQGIVHIIGPELGITQPGQTVVCGDSHTSTHGAMGTLAFGIGTSEVETALATQCLPQFKSKTMLVRIDGKRPRRNHGQGPDARGHRERSVFPAAPATRSNMAAQAVKAMSIEERMTICSMSIECGAKAGMVSPDDATFNYLKGRPYAPRRRGLRRPPSKPGVRLGNGRRARNSIPSSRWTPRTIKPKVTWGTNPGMVADIDAAIPAPSTFESPAERESVERALEYMDLKPGTRIVDIPLDRIFIGSCSNGQIEDLRAAARVLKGKSVAKSIKQALVVPASTQVKMQAEAEGLDKIFVDAGFEWRQSGCSMCIGMNEDVLPPGERCASTSNRNFEGRQGKGGRTHLVSPSMAAAAAVEGRFVDVRAHVDRRLGHSVMQPFKDHTGLTVPLDRIDVDTDQMVPKQFILRGTRDGYGRDLFHDWRYLANGEPNPDFVFNFPRYKNASILLARDNFGCGSSREHAAWAVKDYGFKVIIAPSFADIFYTNAFNNGVLLVTLPAEQVDELFKRSQEIEGYRIVGRPRDDVDHR